MDFLPISKQDMEKRGWTGCDFVYVIGDAYVDHPSFGHAIISRVRSFARTVFLYRLIRQFFFLFHL